MHRFIFIAAAFILFAPEPRAAGAHSHGHHGAGRTAQGELGADAVFDERGALWVAHKLEGRIAVSRTRDLGQSWETAGFVTPGVEPTDPGGDARPKIALGRAGELYVTWTTPMREPYTGEIRFSRSLDGGKTFTPPFTVHRDRQEITHRFDALAVNAKGQIFVAWIDKRDGVAAQERRAPPYRGAAVYFAVSDDRGVTFRGDYKVADHSCECCRIALAPGSDGTVTAFWRHIFAPNIRDHAVATLFPDGKAGEVRRGTFEDWRIEACPHHGPALAHDDRARLHAVWFSGAPEHRGVYYGRLRANGVDGQRAIGSRVAAHADLAVNGLRVAIAWQESSEGSIRLRGLISTDGAETWREVELASTAGPVDHPRVLTRGDRFYVLWNGRDAPLALHAFP